MDWIIAAKESVFDYASYFARYSIADWVQSANYAIGDTIYIYCSMPIQRVRYKCEVLECNLSFAQRSIDDYDFWVDKTEYENAKTKRFVKLKLLSQVDTELLDFKHLQENGLKGRVQGPIGKALTPELIRYIELHFNDFYSQGLFHDIEEHEKYCEGHVINVTVNRYERSSIARMKCIEHHGSKCAICGMDFGKRYGDFGEGFIHVHHLKPLHSIGQEYVVDYKKDLIPVCPNCHAMIHRIKDGEILTISELKNILGEK